MDIRIFTNEIEVEGLREAWQGLQGRAGVSPFSNFDVLQVWWREIARREKASWVLATGWEEGRLVALLPLALYSRKGFRILRIAGHDVFLGKVSLFERPADADALWRAVYARGGFDFAEISCLTPGAEEERAIASFPAARKADESGEKIINFAGQAGEDWFAALSRHERREFKRHRNNLEKRGGTRTVFYERDWPSHEVEKMMALKAAWCEANDKRSSIFKEAFLPSLMQAAPSDGCVLGCLYCGEESIGFSLNFPMGRTNYSYVLAHDEGWSAFSPGILTIVEAIRHFADQGCEVFHFMEGRQAYKDRFANGETVLDSFVFPRTLWGRVGVALSLAKRKGASLRAEKRRR
jgi:CelD/BcsL family acetyltransferase involved in cellulose biosynthesis